MEVLIQKKANANISQKTKVLDYDLNYIYYKTDGISEAKRYNRHR